MSVRTLSATLLLDLGLGRVVLSITYQANRYSSAAPVGSFALTLLNRIGSIPDLVRIRLEEHENHHAGDRNVEPNGERQACDSAVHREPARQREKECREHHRQRDDGKDYVAG